MSRIETPRPIRGTQDMLGEQIARFGHVVSMFDTVRRLYGFGRVEVPVFESTAVFARSLGETTDVVSKEMYSFDDRGGDSLTLRPEFTAGIARAYLTEGWQQHAPLKIATHGPLFRYERPQKGRYRQFHQLDSEVIGASEPQADVELLCLADQLLHELGVAEGVTLTLNTLGDGATRDAWRAALVAHFAAHRSELSEDSLDRLERNPLRILDSKDPRDRPIADAAPAIDAFLSAEAGAFFEAVVKGLDAAGIERLAMLIEAPGPERIEVAVVPMGDAALQAATALLADLRRAGIAADMAYKGNMKKRMQKADASGATWAAIIGDDEVARGEVALKHLAGQTQSAVRVDRLVEVVKG